MSIRVQSYVWENSKQKAGSLLVLLAIADFADDSGRAFPSVSSLAKKARLSERQAQYVLRQLEDDGEITIEPNAGPRGCNLYVITLSEKVQKLRGAKTAGVQSTAPGGAVCDIKGVQPIAPEPSLEPPIEPPHKHSRRARELPSRFTPQGSEGLAPSFTQAEIADELARFRDYHIARGSTFKDWQAAWRTWLRNAVRFRQTAQVSHSPPRAKRRCDDVMSPDYQFQQTPLTAYDFQVLFGMTPEQAEQRMRLEC